MIEATSSTSTAQGYTPCEVFQEIPYIQELLPQTVEEIFSFQHDIQQKVAELLSQVKENPHAWHQATQLVQVAGTKLGYLVCTEFPHLSDDAKASLQEIYKTFKTESEGVYLPQKLPFTYLEGEGKVGEKKSSLTTFNANFLFMPDDYTWFFGGCSRWERRVDALCGVIFKEDPDIVCLQEIHDVDSGYALYERLRGSYCHFYLNIGQGDYTRDPEKIMMNSGLFVASRYPIKDPSFIPFEQEGRQWQINKGFFHGSVTVGEEAFCQLYTSHLNPFDDETAQKVRWEQAEEIALSMKKLQTVDPAPAFLLGDLNVKKHSPEWYFSPLSKEFTHHCPGDQNTCTDTLDAIVRARKNEREGMAREEYLCDYALIYQGSSGAIESRVIPLYDLSDPAQAISDHQGIFSTIRKELTE